MNSLYYLNRETGKLEKESIYQEELLQFLYNDEWVSNKLGKQCLRLLRYPFISIAVGWWQKRSWTKKKIKNFIQAFDINSCEFEKKVEDFSSFNDFFIRKLKSSSRPIDPLKTSCIIPADGRYLFFENFDEKLGLFVKNKQFSLQEFLQDENLAQIFAKGSLVVGRLCPTDYHRFHFPCDGRVIQTKAINGWLYSVNPIALKKNSEIFCQNKRCLTLIDSPLYGRILYIEVGATCVGSIVQTYTNQLVKKGEEKGYFEFGGSTVVLLFEPGRLKFDEVLCQSSQQGIEIRCLFGQRMALALEHKECKS